MLSDSYPKYKVQKEKFMKDTDIIILSVSKVHIKDMLIYLKYIIAPTEDFEYNLESPFMKLFVEHFHEELSSLMKNTVFTYDTYCDLLRRELGHIDKRDAFMGALRYFRKLSCNL